ncbi:hypothetical protein GCM10027059_49880 [Myceligenerans halotolerans]
MSHMRLRRCRDDDRAVIHALRDQVEVWLAEHGWPDQQGPHWSKLAHQAIDRLLDQGRFVALTEGEALLVVGALAPPDEDFWTEADDLDQAWYLARVMSATHGEGYGALFIEMIAAAAAGAGRSALRLDCMRDNTRLHSYYQSLGFELVRIVEHPHRMSGALFERRLENVLPPSWNGVPPNASRALPMRETHTSLPGMPPHAVRSH